MFICSQVHLTDVSSRQLSGKPGGRVRRAQTSKAFLAPGGPSEGRLGRQEACQKAVGPGPPDVLDARRPVGRPSWSPGGPSGDRLGRQEVRREAVLGARRPVGRPSWAPGGPSGGRLGARSPESSVLPTVAAKMQVLRRLQAGRRLQTGGPRLPKLPRRQAPLHNF